MSNNYLKIKKRCGFLNMSIWISKKSLVKITFNLLIFDIFFILHIKRAPEFCRPKSSCVANDRSIPSTYLIALNVTYHIINVHIKSMYFNRQFASISIPTTINNIPISEFFFITI